MKLSDKLARLDALEVQVAFGVWPNVILLQKAARASKRLFEFDVLDAGSAYKHPEYGELGQHLEWRTETGAPSDERGEGIPHLVREDFRKDKDGNMVHYYRECGPIRNREAEAIRAMAALNADFAQNAAAVVANVRAEFRGSLRYIVITDGTRTYSLI